MKKPVSDGTLYAPNFEALEAQRINRTGNEEE